MAKTPADLIQLCEKQQAEKIGSWTDHVDRLESTIDKWIGEGRGEISRSWKDGGLRVDYVLTMNPWNWVELNESPIPEELKYRYRKAGFQEFSIEQRQQGSQYVVKLATYDSSCETEDQRLSRVIATALAANESREAEEKD